MSKTQITILLDTKAKKILENRAKKELMEIDELISDILRRSVLSYKGNTALGSDKVDDPFLTYFSRKGKSKKHKNKS